MDHNNHLCVISFFFSKDFGLAQINFYWRVSLLHAQHCFPGRKWYLWNCSECVLEQWWECEKWLGDHDLLPKLYNESSYFWNNNARKGYRKARFVVNIYCLKMHLFYIILSILTNSYRVLDGGHKGSIFEKIEATVTVKQGCCKKKQKKL